MKNVSKLEVFSKSEEVDSFRVFRVEVKSLLPECRDQSINQSIVSHGDQSSWSINPHTTLSIDKLIFARSEKNISTCKNIEKNFPSVEL